MSTMPGLASKAEKGKSKFQSLDINNLYRHSLGENLERSAQKSAAPLKHGMQSLGKVPSARRPPANLPSVKAEQNNTSSAPITVTSESQLTAASSVVVPPGSAGVQQEQSQSVQQSWVGKQQPGTGDVVAHKIAVVGPGGIGLPTATPAITQQSQHQPQLSAHQAAIALPVTNMILPPHKQQSQQLSAQQVPQGPIGVYHLTAAQQAQLQHLHMQTAAAAAAAAQAQAQTQGGAVQSQGQGGVGGVDKSWSAVMSSVDADGNMVALGAMAFGGTVGGVAAGSHHLHHHHHPLHHHGLQGVQQPPPYHSVQFQHEFPSLSATTDNNSSGAAGGIGGGTGNARAGNQGGVGAQQPQLPQQSLPIGGPDVQYGPGPSLRPQTEGSWMQGGGAQARSSSQQPQQSGTPGGGNVTAVVGQASQPSQPNATATVAHQIPAHFRGIVPPFMYRGGNFPPMNGHHGPMPSQQQHSMPGQHHNPSIQHAEGRQGHPGPPRRGGPTEQQAEVITHRPIIREEELSRMDEMVRDMGWAAHEDIDYNQQLAFSDDDDSVIDAGADSELRSGGSKLQTCTASGQRTKIHGGSRHDNRSERSDHLRSGSHPNHQSASLSLQQQHKESLHHHHQSHHQQHQDASNYPSSYSSRQQQMPQVSSASISGPNNQGGGSIGGYVGGGQTSSATLSQQKSWSSSGSSSAGTGGNRSGGTVITRRSNECDDEIAERRRQQNQAVSTAIERAKQRKEEEEKRYLESKQAANKKLQELDERSKNKREQRELDESTGTIMQASVPPQPIMHSTIPVPEWEREKDNRDNRERNLRESAEEKSLKSSISDENATATSSSTSNFHQLTQIESSRSTIYRKDNASSIRGGVGNTIVDIGVPPPFSRQFQTNLPPRFQKQKQQATSGGAGGPSSLGSLSGQYDQGRYGGSGGGKGNSPPQQQQDRGDRQQIQGQRGLKEDKDIGPRERDSDRDSRDMRVDRDRDRDDHNRYGGRVKQAHHTPSNIQSAASNLPASDDSVTYRQNRYSSSNSNRYSDDYSRDYDYNPNNNSGNNGGSNIRSGGKNNSLTNSSSVGKDLDRRGYEKQDSLEIENMRGSRHSSSDEWGNGRDRYDRERPQRPDSRDSRASRDSRHSVDSTPRLSETRDFASWSESPYEPPYEAEEHKQHKHQQSQSRHLAVPGPITKERLEQSSDDIKSPSNLDKHLHNVGSGQSHNHGGQQQHHQQQPQRSGGLTQLKRGAPADKKNDDAWTIRRGRSSSKEGSGGTDMGGTGTGGVVSTAWADSIPDDKQLGKQVSDHHDNKKDYDDLKGRRNDNRNPNSKGSNWNDSGREQAPYSRNNSWTSSKKSSSSTSSIGGGGGGGGGSRSDRSERLPQGRNQRPPSVKSGESEGSADEVSVTIENSAKDEVTKHIKKIEKDEKNKEILRAILPESVKKSQQPTITENKSKDGIGGGGSGGGCSTAYIPRGEPSRHGRGGGNSSTSFRGGRGISSGGGGSVKRMDYYGLPAASKSPFGNNQDDKDKKVCDDSTVSSHITDEDKAKVQQKKEQSPNEHDKERYGKSKRTDNRRNKPKGPKDDNELASDNSEDGKGGGKRLGNHQKSTSRGGGIGGNASSSGGGGGGRKPLNSGTIGGQIGNQQQSRQQSNSDKRFGNSYGNSGRQNSSGNLRNSNRKDENITKEEDEDDLPRTEDGFQEVRNKKTVSTKKLEDTKSVNATSIGNTSSVVGSAKVPVVSGSGAIVVASVSATVAVTSFPPPTPGGKVEKDCPKGGISGGCKAKAGVPGLSQQQIANIPSLMSVPVNPPMMKGQYDRGRQNKLPPRFAKQRENRLNNQHQQHLSHMDHSPANSTSTGDLNKTANVTTSPSTYVPDGGGISIGTVATSSGGATVSVGNAWDKPLAGQLRNSGLESDVSGLLAVGLDGKTDSLEKLKSSDKTSVLLDSCAAPVNTIIFENSNYKSTSSPAGTAVRVPITTNRNTGPPITPSGGSSSVSSIIGSSAQPRSIQQQMEDQAAAAAEAAVLGALSSGKSDSLVGKCVSKGDVDMMFSKEDDAGMKMDFFETEISHLTDDKATTKNIGLARSIQQTMVGSTGGSISASTADALNIKIQSVKKVWENANDHPVIVQDDGSGFVAGFGPDHNSLDPSGAFSKGADTPDEAHEGYSSSPNQAVSSANTNVCKVKPNQQAAAAAAVAAAQAAAHSGSMVSPGNMVSVAQQHQQQQVHVQQAQQHQQVAHAQAAAVAAAQAAAAHSAAAQAVQMGHHGSTMVAHQVLGHPLSPPPPLPGATVLGAATCQPTGGGGAFGTGQHLGYQSLGGTTNYNLSAIPSPPTVLHQFGSSQSQLQAAAVAAAAQAAAAQAQAVQQNSLYGNFPQLDPQNHQVATARAPQYAPAQYGSPYGLGGSASSPYSTSVPPPPQSLYMTGPPGGPPPPHGPPPGPPGSGTGAQSVPPPPDHLYQNINNYRLAAAAVAAAAGGSPFGNQQNNPATVLISSSNNSSLMSASVVGKSGVGGGGGAGSGAGSGSTGQISAIGTKAGGVGPAYTSHSHSQQAAQQLAYMTYDLSMSGYHLPPPPQQQRGQQGGGPPPGPPPPQGSSQVQQSSSSYYNQNTGGQTGYFQPQQQSSGVNASGQQAPQLGNGGGGGGLATQHAAAAAAYGLQAVATAAALFGNQSHQPISNATTLQNYSSHYLSNSMLAAINVQQQQQQQQQQYRNQQQQYMKSSNQQQLMEQQPGSGGRQQLKSPGSQQDGLSSVFNSGPQIPSPKARQQNCKMQVQQQQVQTQQQQQLPQMSQPSPPVTNVQHNKYNLYNVPSAVTNQPPPGQVRYPAPIQRPVNFQANLGSAQNIVSGNNQKHRSNNPNNRPSTGARQYYGQALNHNVNDVVKSDENAISKLSEQMASSGGAANGTNAATMNQKAAGVVASNANSNVAANVATPTSSGDINSSKDANNSNQQPQTTNKDETSATAGIKD